MGGGEDELRFGPFRLSRRRRELLDGARPVPIGARAFDLLLVLLDRAGRLTSKHELIDLVWPGLAVEENNLHVQMLALRRALGAHAGLIQTVPGRGYRFAGEIAAAEPASPAPPAPVETQLPAETARLIGREHELASLRATLRENRLVTLTGPSGIGKTRLAIALGHAMLAEFAGGARLVDLAPLTDPALVEGAVAAALGIRLAEGTPPAARIAEALGDRPSLLLFDNCEHLLAPVATLAAALLARCPGLVVLATSQEALRISAETIFRLDPLAVPPRGADADLERFGAVALFVRRVEAADRQFRLKPENSAAVAEICRQLDGIPLALEMAAARVPAFGVAGLAARLGERFALLTGGARTAAGRHRTLRDTVAWSFELLDPPDRLVFQRLGVFAGGFSAQAAAAVLAAPGEDEWVALESLFRLIDKSLVVVQPGDPPRYRMLETPRLFALEQLAAAGEPPNIQHRHAKYYAALFAQAYEDWEATEDSLWLARMAPELDNLRAALDWALAAPEATELAISLAGSAGLLWDKVALLAEGRRYVDRAAALISPQTPPAAQARLYRQIGNSWHASDRPRALAALERAEVLYRDLADRPNLGAVLALLGPMRSFLGAAAEAKAALLEARALLQDSGRRKSLLNVMNSLGVQAAIDGDMAGARDLFEQALAITRRAGARDGEVMVLINLAEIEFNLGQIDAAVERTGAAVAYLRQTGRQTDLAWALVNLATYLLIAARLDEAATVAREALEAVRPVGGFILRACLQQWALLAASAGQVEDAAILAGFADAGYASMGETREPTEQQVYDNLRALLRAGLSEPAITRLTLEGAAWTEAEATALAARLAAVK